MEPKHKRAYESLMEVMYGTTDESEPEEIMGDAHPVGAMLHQIVVRISAHGGMPEPQLMDALLKTVKLQDRLLVSSEYGMFLSQSGEVDWPFLMKSINPNSWTLGILGTYYGWRFAAIEAKLEARIKELNERLLATEDSYREQLDAIYAQVAKEDIDTEAFNSEVASRLGIETMTMRQWKDRALGRK